MASVDLLFERSPALNADLVFGQTDEFGRVDIAITGAFPALTAKLLLAPLVDLSITGTFPALHLAASVRTAQPVLITGSFPALQLIAEVSYLTNTQRPTVATATTSAQVADHIQAGITQPEQHAASSTTGFTTRMQDASQAGANQAMTFTEALRQSIDTLGVFADGVLHRASLAGHMQDGDRTPRLDLHGRMQDGDKVRSSLSGRMQDGLHDRRRWVHSRFQDANRSGQRSQQRGNYANPISRAWHSRFQEGWVPRAGLSAPYTPPVVPLPYWGTALVFECPPLTGQPVHLVFGFVCTPTTPAALLHILPARFYMVTHNVYAQRLPDLAEVPIFDATVSADDGSYCWTLQASAPGSVFDLLFPVNGLPAQLLLNMDGIEWVFTIDPPDSDWEFAKTVTTIHGRSVTSIAGAQNPSTWSNLTDKTAQQIALDALSATGIDLDWGIGAGALANGGLVDWLVPAGAWSHRGTPLEAVQAVVGAAGGYLQSHRTAAKLLARHPYGQRIGDVSGAPWALATGAADVELAQDAVIKQGRRYKDWCGVNACYVSGTTQGLLALVKRAGTAGDKLAEMAVDALATHVDAARQRGLSIIGKSAGMSYDPVLELPILTGAGLPGVLDVGQVVQVNATVPWRGRVRSVRVAYNRPILRQTVVLESYMDTSVPVYQGVSRTSSYTNIFRALRDLLPEQPRLVATVAAVHATTGDSTITWPEGSQQRVLGTSVAAGRKAFVRGGVIECEAPALTLETIEV